MAKARTRHAPKILVLDIETTLMKTRIFSTGKQYVGHETILEDWTVMSWAAKWYGKRRMYYESVAGQKNFKDDKRILEKMWKLMDEADIILTQNGISFDQKKLFARFIIHGMPRPSSFRHLDTKVIAKRHFGFSSYSLAYLGKVLKIKNQKLESKRFPGRKLWEECEAGNKEAFKELARYNKRDVLALEEVYSIIRPWDNTINFNVYMAGDQCFCGGQFKENGFTGSNAGVFKRFRCMSCGDEQKYPLNLLEKETREKLRRVFKK